MVLTTIPEAIAFYKNNRVDLLKKDCHQLLVYFMQSVQKLTGLESLYKTFDDSMMMGVVEIPKKYSSLELKNILYDQYKIEIPVIEWNDKLMLRLSVQIFNTKHEIDYFLDVLKILFK